MDQNTLLRGLMKTVHNVLEMTVNDVTGQPANWLPSGVANPIGATYAHAVLSEYGMLHAIIIGDIAMPEPGWGARIGLSEEPPVGGGVDWSEWSRRVRVDLGPLREFATTIYAATDAYLAAADAEELERVVDPGFTNPLPVAAYVTNVMATHIAHHTGEVSALKGLLGAKGYPF